VHASPQILDALCKVLGRAIEISDCGFRIAESIGQRAGERKRIYREEAGKARKGLEDSGQQAEGSKETEVRNQRSEVRGQRVEVFEIRDNKVLFLTPYT